MLFLDINGRSTVGYSILESTRALKRWRFILVDAILKRFSRFKCVLPATRREVTWGLCPVLDSVNPSTFKCLLKGMIVPSITKLNDAEIKLMLSDSENEEDIDDPVPRNIQNRENKRELDESMDRPRSPEN